MNYNKKSVEDIDVAGKRVLCRCDFNVPTKDGKITSDKRIVAALPTIQYLVKHGARVILCSHMGKPKNGPDPAFSLQVVAERLSELLGQPVKMAKDVVGESAQSLAASLKDGEVMLLENTRFEKGETKNDPELSKKLASMADIFVNDAFGTAHRAHASTAGVADYLPAVCGYLVQKEVSIMGKALADPERPFVAILGGAKVSDKLNVINNLLEKVDTLIIGGGQVRGMRHELARCCSPHPGDPVFGFISAEGIIKVHRDDCPNAFHIRARYPYRIIGCRWAGDTAGAIQATVRIIGRDDIGIVTNLTSLIDKEKGVSLASVQINSADGLFTGFLGIRATGRDTLGRLLRKMAGVKGIKQVQAI